MGNKSAIEIVQASCSAGNQQLSTLGLNAKGGDLAVTLLTLQVNLVKQFFAIDWSDDMVCLCASVIYDEFKWLTTVEFKSFINRVLSGFYSDMRNLSPAILTQWLRSYAKEIIEARSQNKPKWIPPENPVSDDVWNSIMPAIIENINANKPDMEHGNSKFPTLEETIERMKKVFPE